MTSRRSMTPRGVRASTLLVIAAAVCFGTTGTAQALGAGDASALSLGSVRIVFGGALLALIALWVAVVARGGVSEHQHKGKRLKSKKPLALVVVGAVGVAAYQPTFFTGTHENGVAVGTLVALGSAPVLTGLLEWVVRRRAPGMRWALATVVAAIGVGALSGVFGPGTDAVGAAVTSVTGLGLLGSLGAGASYAVYALSSKVLLDRGWTPVATMGATFGGAAVIMTPVLLTLDLSWLGRTPGLLSAAWLAVITVALAYTLFARGLRHLPASRAATLTLVEPLTATLLGILLLHEQLTLSIVAGLLLLVAGIVILTTGRRAPTLT